MGCLGKRNWNGINSLNGNWESLVNPSALGAEDPQFKSEIPDHFTSKSTFSKR